MTQQAPEAIVRVQAIHTARPWTLARRSGGLYVMAEHHFARPNTFSVAKVYATDNPACGDQEANARLIAAAPDLLSRSKALISALLNHRECRAEVQALAAVIRTAEVRDA